MSSRIKNPSTFSQDPRGFNDTVWNTPSNASSEDGAYTTANFSGDSVPQTLISQWLNTMGYGFSIPAAATIDGVQVRVKKWQDNSNGQGQVRDKGTGGVGEPDGGVILIKAGSRSGEDKATTTNWPTSNTWVTYGGDEDLWGNTLTPADVNAPNFGVSLGAFYETTGGFQDTAFAHIDVVEITVYYTYRRKGRTCGSTYVGFQRKVSSTSSKKEKY